jgi:hypothetical protein
LTRGGHDLKLGPVRRRSRRAAVGIADTHGEEGRAAGGSRGALAASCSRLAWLPLALVETPEQSLLSPPVEPTFRRGHLHALRDRIGFLRPMDPANAGAPAAPRNCTFCIQWGVYAFACDEPVELVVDP